VYGCVNLDVGVVVKSLNIYSCLTERSSVLSDADDLPGLNHLLGMVFISTYYYCKLCQKCICV